MTRALHDQRGFGIIEALAAVALFAVAAVALSATTATSLSANHTSRDVSAASALIYDKIDELRSLNPDAADMASGKHVDASNPLTATGDASGKYTRTWVVTENTPKVGMAQVVVAITWTVPEPRSIQAVTYVCLTNTCSLT